MTIYVYSSFAATGLCVLIQQNTSTCISLSDMLLLQWQRGKAPICFTESGHWRKVVWGCYFFSVSQLLCISVLIYVFKSACEGKSLFFPFAPLNQSRDLHSCQKAASVSSAGLPGAPRTSLRWTHLYKHLLNTSGAPSLLADAWGWTSCLHQFLVVHCAYQWGWILALCS